MAEKTVVKFGTDGWRGIIADDFTYANVRVAVAAIANYVLAHEDAKAGVLVGWDTRFASQSFARVAAKVLSEAGIPVQLARGVTPTPALSYAVRNRKAAGGVMITSSHNPAEWNGVKYKASYGGSGKPSIMASIESYLDKPLAKAAAPAPITEEDFLPEYVAAIEKLVDLDAIKAADFRFLLDVMYGAGRGVVAGIFAKNDIRFTEIRNEINPAFPGINPEPILPHIRETQVAVVGERCDAGL
ncbi:MAG TPA: phosphoglucomutase/phosphomannomutase family protein, partial [Edaphobacter sp.]